MVQIQDIKDILKNYEIKIEDNLLIYNEKNVFKISTNDNEYTIDIKTPYMTKKIMVIGFEELMNTLYLELLRDHKYYNDLLIM